MCAPFASAQGIRDKERRERMSARQRRERLSPDGAALVIQTNMRRVLAKKKADRMRDKELTLIGMVQDREARKRKDDPLLTARKIEEDRRHTQAQYETQYQVRCGRGKESFCVCVCVCVCVSLSLSVSVSGKQTDKIAWCFLQTNACSGRFRQRWSIPNAKLPKSRAQT